MDHRSKKPSAHRLTLNDREHLERVVVRLVEVADRCSEPRMQYQLMELAEQVAKLIEA